MINIANMSKVYSEVYAFMNTIGEEYSNKVPSKIYDKIKNNRDINYNPSYQSNQIMTEAMISKEALALIAALNLQYWCDDEKREELKQCYRNNAEKEAKKYSYENLFKKEFSEDIKIKNISKMATEETNLPIEMKKKTIFEKIVNIIRKLINKK